MRLPLVLALLLALSACSGSGSQEVSYDATQNETVYRSSAIPLGRPAQGGPVTSQRLLLRAEATCLGEACAPEQYIVTLSRTGAATSAVDYDQISFETAEGAITFSENRDTDGYAQFFGTSQGEFVRIAVPKRIYRSFAEAPSLVVRLGGSEYRLDYGIREPLRRILPASAAAENGAAADD